MPKLANAKRVSLEGVNDGWTSECYALIAKAGYADQLALNELVLAKDNVKLVTWQLDFVKKHLITGKVMVFDDKFNLVLGDLLPEYVDNDKALADVLFNEITGVTADPKGSSPSTETANSSSPTNSSTTEPSATTNNTKTQ